MKNKETNNKKNTSNNYSKYIYIYISYIIYIHISNKNYTNYYKTTLNPKKTRNKEHHHISKPLAIWTPLQLRSDVDALTEAQVAPEAASERQWWRFFFFLFGGLKKKVNSGTHSIYEI